MRLSPLQLKVLKRYDKFHRENYHSSVMILASAPLWVIALICLGASYFLTTIWNWPNIEHLGWFGIGYFAAVVLLSIKSIRLVGQLWPMLEELINWERVEQLLQENDPEYVKRRED